MTLMKVTGESHRRNGFTLIEALVILIVLIVIGFLAIPAGPRLKPKSDRLKCVSNLKNVGLAFRIFATDNGDRFPMSMVTAHGGTLEYTNSSDVFRHFLAMSNELSTPKILICPSDQRKEATNWSDLRNVNLSYFVAVNADRTMPHHLLAGDRNLTTNGVSVRSGILNLSTNSAVGWSRDLHDGQGNIALADGSVQQVSRRRLRDHINTTGINVTRLAVP